MAVKTIAELKALWINGYVPVEQDYTDLFDTIVDLAGGGEVTDELVSLVNTFDEIKGGVVTDAPIGNLTLSIFGASNFVEITDDTNPLLAQENLPVTVKIVTANEVGYLNIVQNYGASMGFEASSFGFLDVNGNDLPYTGGTGNLETGVALPASIEQAQNAAKQNEFNAGIINFVKTFVHSISEVLNKGNKANDVALELGNTQEIPSDGGGVRFDYYGMQDLSPVDSVNRFLSMISNNGIQLLAKDNISIRAENAGKALTLQAAILRFTNRVNGDNFGTGQFDFTQMSNNQNRVFTFPDKSGTVALLSDVGGSMKATTTFRTIGQGFTNTPIVLVPAPGTDKALFIDKVFISLKNYDGFNANSALSELKVGQLDFNFPEIVLDTGADQDEYFITQGAQTQVIRKSQVANQPFTWVLNPSNNPSFANSDVEFIVTTYYTVEDVLDSNNLPG